MVQTASAGFAGPVGDLSGNRSSGTPHIYRFVKASFGAVSVLLR